MPSRTSGMSLFPTPNLGLQSKWDRTPTEPSSTPTARSAPKQIVLAPQIPCYFCSLVFPIDLRAKVNHACGSLLVLFNLACKRGVVPPGSVPFWKMHQLLPLLELHFKEAWISKQAVRDYILEGEITGHRKPQPGLAEPTKGTDEDTAPCEWSTSIGQVQAAVYRFSFSFRSLWSPPA